MAHFARLDSESKVVGIHAVRNEVILNGDSEDEQIGIQFLQKLHRTNDNFVQCSFNASFRNIFPMIGASFDQEQNIFIDPKPYESWLFDENTKTWVAPVPMPSDSEQKQYEWNEDQKSWVEVV